MQFLQSAMLYNCRLSKTCQQSVDSCWLLMVVDGCWWLWVWPLDTVFPVILLPLSSNHWHTDCQPLESLTHEDSHILGKKLNESLSFVKIGRIVMWDPKVYGEDTIPYVYVFLHCCWRLWWKNKVIFSFFFTLGNQLLNKMFWNVNPIRKSKP